MRSIMNVTKSTSKKVQVCIVADAMPYFSQISDGIRRAAKADFLALPENPSWDDVLCLGVMIDGYEVADAITGEHIQNFHRMKEVEYEKSGAWSGSALELWTVLFYYNRMNHWNEGYGFREGERLHKLAMAAYQALRTRLMNPDAIAEINFKTI